MKGKIKSLYKSNFIRNATKLAAGTGISQVLALVFLPILTRLYSQDAFGLLTAFTTVIGFISSFATLKYDTALVLPKDDRDAYSLLKLSNVATIIITILCVFVMFIPIPYFAKYQGLQVFIGIGVLLSVNYNNSALWNIRFKHFNSTSISTIIQVIAVFAFQYILFSFFNLKGLVIGNILGIFISGIYLIVTRKFNWSEYRSISKKEMIVQAKRYIDFPKYFTFSNFILSLSSSLPVLLFVKFIPLAQIGIYGIALKIIAQPTTLISNSLKSVVLGDMAERRNNNKPIINWYIKIFFSLFLISLIVSILLILFGDMVVNFFLGDDWSEAGLYAKMLIPILISLMIATPGIAAVRVFELQKYTLKYSIVSLVIKTTTLLGLFSSQIISFKYIILIYSVVCLSLVLVNNCIIISKIKLHEGQFKIN